MYTAIYEETGRFEATIEEYLVILMLFDSIVGQQFENVRFNRFLGYGFLEVLSNNLSKASHSCQDVRSILLAVSSVNYTIHQSSSSTKPRNIETCNVSSVLGYQSQATARRLASSSSFF